MLFAVRLNDVHPCFVFDEHSLFDDHVGFEVPYEL